MSLKIKSRQMLLKELERLLETFHDLSIKLKSGEDFLKFQEELKTAQKDLDQFWEEYDCFRSENS